MNLFTLLNSPAHPPRWATASALISGAVVALAVWASPALAQQGAVTLRAEVAQPLQQARQLIQDKQGAQALGLLQNLDRVANKTPAEVYLIERLRAAAAQEAGNPALATTALAAALATGQTPAADKPGLTRSLAARQLQLGQFEQAITTSQAALDLGVSAAEMVPLQAQAHFNLGQISQAASLMRPHLEGVAQAGQTPRKDLLEFLARCYLRLKDDAGYERVLAQLLAHHPSKAYWGDLLNRVGSRAHFPPALQVDLERLRWSLNALEDADDYLALAQQLHKDGFAAEAAAVLAQGYADKHLGQGAAAGAHEALRSQVQRAVDEDKKTAPQVAAQLPGRSAAVWFKSGLNQVYLGDAAGGLATMRQALTLPGGDVPENRLRLGAALWHSGAKAEAAKWFSALAAQTPAAAQPHSAAAVELARLWALRKAGP